MPDINISSFIQSYVKKSAVAVSAPVTNYNPQTNDFLALFWHNDEKRMVDEAAHVISVVNNVAQWDNAKLDAIPDGSVQFQILIRQHDGNGANYQTLATVKSSFIAIIHEAIPAPNNPLKAIAAVASSSDTNLAPNVIDGDLNTRWSGDGDGTWVQVELEQLSEVSHVGIAPYRGTERRNKFDILLSTDGQTWVEVVHGAQSSGTTDNVEIYQFATTPAKFVRYLGHGNNGATGVGSETWNSITELVTYGNVIGSNNEVIKQIQDLIDEVDSVLLPFDQELQKRLSAFKERVALLIDAVDDDLEDEAINRHVMAGNIASIADLIVSQHKSLKELLIELQDQIRNA